MKRNKRNRRRGGKTMLLGLLLVGASMLLSAYNLAEQQQADASSAAVLTQMKISEVQEEQVQTGGLMPTDEAGKSVAWPLDDSLAPLPWPVEDGKPVEAVTDAKGNTFAWSDVQPDTPDAAQAWTADENGALLPWIRDEAGQTVPWPTDSQGKALNWSEIHEKWQEIVLQLLPYQLYAQEIEDPLFVSNPDVEMPTQEIDGHDYIGILEIPGLELFLPVMAEWSYPKFKKAPCRYVGSVYTGDIVIAAHNYDRHFGRIKTLEIGDAVRFTDVEGNVFNYAVSGFETLGKKDVEQMEAGEWDLTLFTCTPGGAKRVTVRCVQRSYLWNRE